MTVSRLAFVTAEVLLGGHLLLAQSVPQPDLQQRMEAAAKRQRLAASAMTTSIERQKKSVGRQPHYESASALQAGWPSSEPLPAPTSFGCAPIPEPLISSLVEGISHREGLEPGLIRSVMRAESGFRPCAVSPKGALGLMQLMPATALDLKVDNPFDPYENATGGGRLLKTLLDRYGGDMAVALSAYNAGPATVDRAGGVPLIPETLNYLRQILPVLPPLKSDILGEMRGTQ